MYALSENNYLCRLNAKNLTIIDTINIVDFIPSVSTNIAHPHIDNSGTWITMGINNLNKKNACYEFIKYDGTGRANRLNNLCENGEILASIPSRHRFAASYIHSFGVTKSYIILLEHALTISFKDVYIGALLNKARSDALVMKPNWKTRIHIINKHTGEVARQEYSTEPLFVFHHINAYEMLDMQEKKVILIVDICAYDPKTFVINDLNYAKMFTNEMLGSDMLKSVPKRIIIPLDTDFHAHKPEIHCQLIEIESDLVLEWPTINYSRFNGLAYKYVYGVNCFKKPFSIVKLNVDKPTEILEKTYVDGKKDFLLSEPIFVERPDPASEDDGVLLVMVLADKRDYLSILDAVTLQEIAQAQLPDGVKASFTFHGFFASKKKFPKLNY